MASMLELPEDCMAKVLSLTDPREACRLSIISSDFNHIAQSDAVWKKFLPSDYPSLISRSSSTSLCQLPSLKQLYLSLCDNPILIDDGKTSFSLEKWSGKKIYMISARSLTIIWGDTPDYWRWNPNTNSRFGETAELIAVCWLEIRGKFKTPMLSTSTVYGIYLVYKLKRQVYGFDHPRLSLEVTVGVVDSGVIGERKCSVYDGKKREDGWLEIELGEFLNGKYGGGELEVHIMGITRGNWKGGLVVQGIEFRPKNVC